MSDTAVAESGTRLQNFLDRAGFRGFPWKTAIILYTISYGWFWNVRNSYWADDWFMYAVRNLEFYNFDQLGTAPWSKAFFYTYDIVGVAAYRGLTFLMVFLISVLVFRIFNTVDILTQSQAKFLSLVVLLLATNTSAVPLMNGSYFLTLFLFVFAWNLYLVRGLIALRAISIGLFFFSMAYHTLVFLIIFPIAHFVILENERTKTGWSRAAAKCWPIFLIPISYALLRQLFWPPQTSYHQPTALGLKNLIVTATYFCCFIVFLFLVAKYLRLSRNGIKVICLAIFWLFVGLAPYVISQNLSGAPKLFVELYVLTFGRSDWYSRHLIAQSLGVGLLFCGLLLILAKLNKRAGVAWCGLVITALVSFNVGFGFEYVVDYAKQQAVVEKLERDGEVAGVNEYMFADRTNFLNARGRLYRPRDWWGLVWSAYGLSAAERAKILSSCDGGENGRFVEINGPETHWQALKNWVGDGDMGFEVTIDDSPGACKPELMQTERVSGAIPILFYFTGAKG